MWKGGENDMNKLCKQYISDVKTFFPIIRKGEKKYLDGLSVALEEYCEERETIIIDDIYTGFGTPNDVANAYYASTDIQKTMKNIRISKYVRFGITVFLLILLIAVSIYGVDTYRTTKIFEEEKIQYRDITIE